MILKTIFNKLVQLLFRPKRKEYKWGKPGNYISCEQTVDAAANEGQSVADYIETLWNQKGNSQGVINKFASVSGKILNTDIVLEIGAGTGRYLDKVIKDYKVKTIYSYETAEDWSNWLAYMYSPVCIKRNADGKSLSHEKDESIDIVFAHGVFVYLPFLNSVGYFSEIVRVLRGGGACTFRYMYN